MPTSPRPRPRAAHRLAGLVVALAAVASAPLLSPPQASAAVATGVPAGASGAYTGACKTAESSSFATWRGKANSVVVDTLDMRRYSNIADPSWWTGCWGAGAPVVYGVAMVTYEDGGSNQAGAAGAYDTYWRSMAQKLVAGGQPGAWLRLGFEFNGGWFPWRAGSDPAAFTAHYRRIVDVMRSVPGAQFKYVWNPTVGLEQFAAERTWPGSNYVDAIGLDLYDACWAPGTYPFPAGATAEETRTRQDAAWQHIKTMDHGLDWWVRYAALQAKPLALPEWGLVPRSMNGGGDNPSFIQHVREWASQQSLAFESYFDAVGDLGDHRLRSGQYPEAATRYRQLFGPAATPPVGGSIVSRINVGGGTVTEAGVTWSADTGYLGGTVADFPSSPVNSTTPVVDRSERWGAAGYEIPVPSNGNYRVRLRATELYFDSPGQRVFDISAEGVTAARQLDLFATVGKNRTWTKEVPVTVNDGKVSIRLAATSNYATLSGIEVLKA